MASGPLPLVIGITGHRDLRAADIPALENALRGVMRDLQAQYPNTPLLVLSSLAEGADRLGARVALESGARLVVPLPMDLLSYERDFESETSRAEFRELLGRGERSIEVPPLPVDGKAPAHDASTRDELYERAGAFIAVTCQILIAMWDGNETGLVGGTAEIVRFKLNGVDQRYQPGASPLDPPDTGPVIRILTPRSSGPPVAGAFTVETLYPEVPGETRKGEETYERRVFTRIETFNHDTVRLAADIVRGEPRSSAQLSSTTGAPLGAGAASIQRTYAITDVLALHFQGKSRRVLATLFVWIFVAAALFEAYKGLAEGYHLLVGLYAAAVAAASVWYYVANREDSRSKFLDYRALAEGLRVQFFWWLGGIHEDVASHYLRKQRGELDWIRVGAANANFLANLAQSAEVQTSISSEAVAQSLRAVLTDWVQSQHGYYVRAALRDQRLSDRLDEAARWFLGAAIALTVARALLLVVHVGVIRTIGEWLSTVSIAPRLADVFITVLFVIAALLHNYAEKRALSQQAKQYERMGVMFGACSRRLPALIDDGQYEQARDLIRELGREALNENADWVLLHRERPLELSMKG